jgi:hypothetical protein
LFWRSSAGPTHRRPPSAAEAGLDQIDASEDDITGFSGEAQRDH